MAHLHELVRNYQGESITQDVFLTESFYLLCFIYLLRWSRCRSFDYDYYGQQEPIKNFLKSPF